MDIKKVYGGDLNPYAQKLTENPRVNQPDQNASQASEAAKQGDKVALSPEARLLATAMTTATSASDVRAEKVRDLKSQVQSGTYKPDIKKAAANLLRDEVSLTSNK